MEKEKVVAQELAVKPETRHRRVGRTIKEAPKAPPGAFQDLRRILASANPSALLRELQALGILRDVLPELEALKGIEQPAKTHGCDAFDHTLRVIDAARGDPCIENSGDIELMLAALLHDIGKAKTQGYDPKQGRITFHGHQIVSQSMATRRLEALQAKKEGIDIKRVGKLIRHHMFDLNLKISDKALRRFINRIGSDLVIKLLDLRVADKRGGARPERIGPILEFKRLVKEEFERKEPFGFKNLMVTGHDVIAAGIQEGPMIGLILKEILAAVLENPSLNTRERLLEMIAELKSRHIVS